MGDDHGVSSPTLAIILGLYFIASWIGVVCAIRGLYPERPTSGRADAQLAAEGVFAAMWGAFFVSLFLLVANEHRQPLQVFGCGWIVLQIAWIGTAFILDPKGPMLCSRAFRGGASASGGLAALFVIGLCDRRLRPRDGSLRLGFLALLIWFVLGLLLHLVAVRAAPSGEWSGSG
ncbi:MAG: hypothetical protein AAF196_00310 [Planctomycetota bacterium]